MSDKDTTPTTISVEGTDFTADDILKLKEQAGMLEQNKGLIEAGELFQQAAKAAAEGDPSQMNELKAFLEKKYPGAKKADAITLEKLTLSDSATENEKAIAEYMNKQTDAFTQHQARQEEHKNELNDLVKQALGASQQDSTASKAVKQVEAELGIKVTAEEIKAAMQAENISDPVKAVKLHRFDDLVKPTAATSVKPNMVVNADFDKDFSKMTLKEKMALPEEVKQQILDKQKADKSAKGIFADVD